MSAGLAGGDGWSVQEVASGVWVATARKYTTTTTIVAGEDGGCLLVDPAVSVADLAALAGWLADRELRPVAGWSTHPHWDHLLWSAALGGAPRYATPRAVAVAAREEAGLIEGVTDGAPGHDLTLFARVTALTGREIDWPGPRAVVLAHDAHAPGHGAVFLPGTGVLIAGDMCSDIEIPLPDLDAANPPDVHARNPPDVEAANPPAPARANRPAPATAKPPELDVAKPFRDYRDGLALLADTDGVEILVPGHGHVGDGAEFRRRVGADLAYLDAVAAGTDITDERLTEAWLRTEHARALALARAVR